MLFTKGPAKVLLVAVVTTLLLALLQPATAIEEAEHHPITTSSTTSTTSSPSTTSTAATTTTTTTITTSTTTTTERAPTTTAEEVPDLVTQITTPTEILGELVVSMDSPFCDWTKTMGPMCVYTETDQVVIVPEGLTLPSGKLELEIRNAQTLHVYPACVPWIMVKNVSLVTTLPNKDSSNFHPKVCKTWLRLRNSRADNIASGVRDLSIRDTHVNTISLIQQKDFSTTNSVIVNIEALHWDGYPSEIINTTIRRIGQLVAGGNWWVIDSFIGTVAVNGISFMASEMDITNSTISYISHKGLRIMSGTATFSNVLIHRLETSAIMVENPSAFLYLYNVTILAASGHCIVLPDRERLAMKNVTIAGKALNTFSNYLRFEEDYEVPKGLARIQVKTESDRCSSTPLVITCDFSGNNKMTTFFAGTFVNHRQIRIKDAMSLDVPTVACNQELLLESVNGTLSHLSTNKVAWAGDNQSSSSSSDSSKSGSKKCDVVLTISGSQLGVILAKVVSNITVANTTVKRLHDGTLKALNAYNFTVGTMDGMTMGGAGSRWSKLKIGMVFNVTLKAPVKAEDILVNSKLRKGALTIDHAHASTEFSKLWVSIVQKEGIVVKSGKLILRNFRFSELLEGAIQVEEDATIEVDKIIGMPDYASISVAKREQVVLNGISSWYAERMIHVRHHPPPPDLGSNVTITNPNISPSCRKFNISFSYRECDFSHIQNASVVVDLEGTEQTYQTVEIRNASFVKLYPSCIRKLHLVHVTEATTVDSEKDCETWLVADGVHFKKITAGVHDVTLTSCSVELFAPFRMLKDLDLENTRIQRVAGAHWYGYMGVFNNTYLGKVEGLVASSFIFVLNTTVERILPQGLTVLADGLIVNSSISVVESAGISVEGGLRIANVTIGHLAKKAIVVKDGVLVLSNVTIGSSEEESIMATLNGAVAMQNVTVAGKKVHWRGYITDSLGPNDPSLVFVNKYVDEQNKASNTSASTQEDKVQREESSKTTLPSSSTTETEAPDDKENPSSLQPSDAIATRQIDLASSPWKWVGVSLSVFLVILLGCCIVLAVTLVKTNNGRMLPVVFWRVMDDQNGLVGDDQPSSNLSGPTRHTGYHQMPGNYDM